MYDDEKIDFSKRPVQPVDDKLKNELSEELSKFINPEARKEKVAPVIPVSIPTEQPLTSGPSNFSSVINKLDQKPAQMKPIIRTYTSDVEETISSGHLSSVNIAISQNQRMLKNIQTPPVETAAKSRISRTVLAISIFLFVAGVAAAFLPYYFVQKDTPSKPAPITVINKNIFSPDTEEKINIKKINKNRVALTLRERVEQSAIDLGQIKNIVLMDGDAPSETVIPAQDFLSLIKANVPPEILRTLRPEYMFGMHNFNGYQEFLILKVGSYDTTFTGMLNWETFLWQDIKPLFGLNNSGTSTVSTSSERFSETSIKFQDIPFFNKDCRVVKDADGKIIFLYSIVDENTIVFTTSTDTLKEILSRLSSSRKVTQ